MAADEAEDLEALVLSYALGTAPESERSRLKQAMVRDPRLAKLLAEVDDSLEAVVMGFDAPRAPWKTVAENLQGGRRFTHLVPRLATLFDITPAAAAALTERVDTAAEWMEGPGQGVWLMPVEAGPKWTGYITTLLRLEPGSHRVVWNYRPRSVLWGAVISVGTLLFLAAVAHVRFWHPARLSWLGEGDSPAR